MNFSSIDKKSSDKIMHPFSNKVQLPLMNQKSIFIDLSNCSEIYEIIKGMELTNDGVESINSTTLKLNK